MTKFGKITHVEERLVFWRKAPPFVPSMAAWPQRTLIWGFSHTYAHTVWPIELPYSACMVTHLGRGVF